MKAEILKYSEYKIAHALWIQTQVKERTNIGFNTDQLCLELYSEYLKICGVKNSKFYKTIKELQEMVNSFSTFGTIGFEKYDERVAKDIDFLMNIYANPNNE